jgi:hypothetical protein
MPDPHGPCYRCKTTDADAFDTPTSSYCRTCWAWVTDYGRRMSEWAGRTIDAARSGRGPFSA